MRKQNRLEQCELLVQKFQLTFCSIQQGEYKKPLNLEDYKYFEIILNFFMQQVFCRINHITA